MEAIDLNNVEDSKYIDDAGTHQVLIVNTRDHIFDSGNTGFMIQMKDERGRMINDRIVVQANTLWKLKAIATAAGLTDHEMGTFTHEMLQDRSVTITTAQDGQYQKIVKYETSDTEVVPPAPVVEEMPF